MRYPGRVLALLVPLASCGPLGERGTGGTLLAPAPVGEDSPFPSGGTAPATTAVAGVDLARGSDGAGRSATFRLPQGVAVDASGNVYVADHGNCTIRKIAPSGLVTTVAGSPGQAGSADGAGPAARFNFPSGVALDGAGNVYVADTRNHVIRRIDAAGRVTTLAGSPGQPGSIDGSGPAARFCYPGSVAADASGNVYVTDNSNFTIRKISPAGVVTTVAGSPASWRRRCSPSAGQPRPGAVAGR